MQQFGIWHCPWIQTETLSAVRVPKTPSLSTTVYCMQHRYPARPLTAPLAALIKHTHVPAQRLLLLLLLWDMEITGGSNRCCLDNLTVEFCLICGVRTMCKTMELTTHESLNKHLCSARKVKMSKLSDKYAAIKMAKHGSFSKPLLLSVQIKRKQN